MCTRGPECQLRSFGAAGCVVPTDCDRKCGQTDTLEIAKEFHRCYEMKMKIIEQECSPDQLQDKLKLQREWIEDLKEQNDMLIACIQELEYEATHRVLCLEEKLKESAKCICEVMKKYREHDVASDLLSEPLQKIFDLENDQQSLLLLINRGRFRNDWNTDDLRFLTIKRKDIFDETYKEDNSSRSASSLMKMTEQLWQKENALNNEHMLFEQARGNVLELEQKIITCSARDNTDYVFEDLKRARNDYEILKRQTEDMRHALTEEVASKHDMILALKKDCQQLEERCLQADKQTAFKDDIIKELRKEIKQLKQQIPEPDKSHFLTNTHDHISEDSLSQDSYLNNDLYCVKSNQKPFVTINHSRKSIQSGKSTVIYIYKEKSKNVSEKSCESDQNLDSCSNATKSQINTKTKKLTHKIYERNSGNVLHPCKSENDLGFQPWENPIRPVKDKSKFTSTTLSRYNTFVGTRRETSEEDEKVVSVPNHMPVKMHVRNIENRK